MIRLEKRNKGESNNTRWYSPDLVCGLSFVCFGTLFASLPVPLEALEGVEIDVSGSRSGHHIRRSGRTVSAVRLLRRLVGKASQVRPVWHGVGPVR